MFKVIDSVPDQQRNPMPADTGQDVNYLDPELEAGRVAIIPEGVEVDPASVVVPGVLGRDASNAFSPDVSRVPVIPGRPGVVDPPRARRSSGTIMPQADAEQTIKGLQQALEVYRQYRDDMTTLSTANRILADLTRGGAGRHDAEYRQRLIDAQHFAAYLLRDPQDVSDHAVHGK